MLLLPSLLPDLSPRVQRVNLTLPGTMMAAVGLPATFLRSGANMHLLASAPAHRLASLTIEGSTKKVNAIGFWKAQDGECRSRAMHVSVASLPPAVPTRLPLKGHPSPRSGAA